MGFSTHEVGYHSNQDTICHVVNKRKEVYSIWESDKTERKSGRTQRSKIKWGELHRNICTRGYMVQH